MDRNGISKLDLKRLNRAEILRLITRNGPISRIDISHHLKLTRAAVTIITNDMIAQKIIYEKGEQQKSGVKNPRGRKKILLDINENYRFSVGVVIEREKLEIGLANLKGATLSHRTVSLQISSLHQLVELMDQVISEILADNCLSDQNLLGIGVCISHSLVEMLPDPGNINQIVPELKRLMEIRFSIPIIIDSTTESLANAEILFNPNFQNKPSNMIFIRYGHDVDAAIMLNEQIYRGSHNNAGWFPHLVVDAHGERCNCGKVGCCVTKMSISRIIEKIKQLYLQGETPLLYEATDGNIHKIDFSISNLKNILADDSVKALYKEALEYLTTVLDNLLIILDPDQVVLFGFVFEKILDIEMLNEIMETEHNCSLREKVTLSTIPDHNIHLAGNGLCVKQLFIDRGGLD